MTLLCIIVIFSVLVHTRVSSYWCPCGKNRQLLSNATRICVTSFNNQVDINGMVGPESGIVSASSLNGNLKDCVAVVSIVSEIKTKRQLCPGMCRPIPNVEIEEHLLRNKSLVFSEQPLRALTCSMTMGMVQNKLRLVDSTKIIENLLWLVVNRRIAECYEQGKYAYPVSNHLSPHYSTSSRRNVKSVVMWMGTANNIKLIQSQSQVLQEYPDQGASSDAIVIGWAATDDLYPCTDESTTCTTGTKQYNGLLPASAMNFMPVGWRCAQRRPLRSLAHVLSLFNPQFVVLLDDDTYLNYKLLMDKFGSYLHSDMVAQPIYMGEFQGRSGDRGHLSTMGIFAGGSGYIIGHNLLSKLHQKAATYFGFEDHTDFGAKLSGNSEVYSRRQSMDALSQQRDEYRSAEHRLWLSVLNEGVEHSAHACSARTEGVTGAESCILSMKPLPFGDVVRGAATGRHKMKHASAISVGIKGSTVQPAWNESDLVVPIAVRLVDFCSALMANDHTCQHSDHSLGRCMLYGARAIPVGVGCHSLVNTAHKDVKIGMCFMSPTCNTSEQITCHRYKAGSSYETIPGLGVKVLTPERNSPKNGYYRHHSSVYDGKIVDSVG